MQTDPDEVAIRPRVGNQIEDPKFDVKSQAQTVLVSFLPAAPA